MGGGADVMRRWLGSLLVAALALAGCGASDDDTVSEAESATPSATATTEVGDPQDTQDPPEEPMPTGLAEATEVPTTEPLADEDAATEDSPAEPLVEPGAVDDDTTQAGEPSPEGDPSDGGDVAVGAVFAMWPVLAQEPDVCSGIAVDGYCRAGDGPVLGPEVVESAEPFFAPSAVWVVTLVLTEAGIDEFNAVAAVCFQRSAECPNGQVAVQVGDQVVSAPQVNAPAFERDQISISGDFDEQEARALAEALTTGA